MYIILIALGLFAVLLVIYHISNSGPTLHGSAQVTSRRVDHARASSDKYCGSRWNYLVTFTLSDGESLELYVTEGQYRELKEGIRGHLCWQQENMLSFEPELQRYVSTEPDNPFELDFLKEE